VIEVSSGSLAEARAGAVLRPTRTDWTPTTAEVRRLDVAAGEGWLERCSRQGDLVLGAAAITDAGELGAEFVVHLAVCSREDPVNGRTVAMALRNALRRAAEWDVAEVAVPLLGTGPGGLDLERACRIMAPLLESFVAGGEGRVVRVAAEDPAEHAAATAVWPAG